MSEQKTARDLWLWQIVNRSDKSLTELLGLFEDCLKQYRALAEEGVAHDDFGNDLSDAIKNVESSIADIKDEQSKRVEPTTQGERDKITARLQDVTADPADELTQVSEEMGLYPDREQP